MATVCAPPLYRAAPPGTKLATLRSSGAECTAQPASCLVISDSLLSLIFRFDFHFLVELFHFRFDFPFDFAQGVCLCSCLHAGSDMKRRTDGAESNTTQYNLRHTLYQDCVLLHLISRCARARREPGRRHHRTSFTTGRSPGEVPLHGEINAIFLSSGHNWYGDCGCRHLISQCTSPTQTTQKSDMQGFFLL